MTLEDSKQIQPLLESHGEAIRDLAEGYRRKLGPYRDPFALALTSERADRIFRNLLVRDGDGRAIESPLAVINSILKLSYLSKSQYRMRDIDWLIVEARRTLALESSRRLDLQSNLIALEFAMEYVDRYRAVQYETRGTETANESEPKDQRQKSQNESQKRDQSRVGEKQTPDYPELPEKHKPHTKDSRKSTSGQAGQPQKRVRVAEVNFPTAYFAQQRFVNIVRGAEYPFQTAKSLGIEPRPEIHRPSSHVETIRTFGRREVSLYLPPLFRPLQPSDPRATIEPSGTGGYLLKLSADLPEVNFNLVPEEGAVLNPVEAERLKRPIGFTLEEWPDLVQAEVIRKFSVADGQRQPLKVARVIADHLSTAYRYSVGARPERDPIDALKAGAFQCDMAAFAMMGLLRDVYRLPSRVVGGFRAKNHKLSKEGRSYLVFPDDAHVWIEVYHDGRWHPFDPTPVNRDQKEDDESDKNGEPDEYTDNKLEDAPDSDDGRSSRSGNPDGVENRKTPAEEHKRRLDENTKNSRQAVERLDQENKEYSLVEDGKRELSRNETETGAEGDRSLSGDELARQLEIGSLDLESRSDRNPLLDRLTRVVLRTVLDPNQDSSTLLNRLNGISSLVRLARSSEITALVNEAEFIHRQQHDDLRSWVASLAGAVKTEDVNKSYEEIRRVRSAVNIYARLLDDDGKVRKPRELLKALDQTLEGLQVMTHPNAQDMGLVSELMKDLPSVVHEIMRRDYGLTTVGSNAPTRVVADKLRAGELNDLRLLSALSPNADFIMSSRPRPEGQLVKSWIRDPSKSYGRDLLPLQRFRDLARALRGQPGKSLEENFQDGTLFVRAHRKRVSIPTGQRQEESERLTVILYDTSNSMSGGPARFQAALIAAFVGKALSDVAPSGRFRHPVVIVPFDEDVGTPVSVSNADAAIDVIRNYRARLRSTHKGTNIQKALLQAFALIADAQARSSESLAAGNVLLMTDGAARIDVGELRAARGAIDRETPLQVMFAAINDTNPDLMRFAVESESIGFDQGHYREFTAEHIDEYLTQADRLELAGRDDFYTEQDASVIPEDVLILLERASDLAAAFASEVRQNRHHTQPIIHLHELERLRLRDVKQVDRPLETWLVKLRQRAMHPVFQMDRRLLEVVLDDLVVNFEKISGVSLESLSDYEREHLRHLIRAVAGLE